MNGTWYPDRKYRFQLAFFPKDPYPPKHEFVSLKPLDKVAANEPDIANLELHGFLKRGFLPNVKAQSNQQNLFLKLFEFPGKMSQKKSCENILDRFLLTKMENGEVLQKLVEKRENIFIKFAWIELAANDFSVRPFPRFLLPSKDTQDYFDGSLPFSSLYVEPADARKSGLTEKQLFEHSRMGALAFYDELCKQYTKDKDLEEIKTRDLSKMLVRDSARRAAGSWNGSRSSG